MWSLATARLLLGGSNVYSGLGSYGPAILDSCLLGGRGRGTSFY